MRPLQLTYTNPKNNTEHTYEAQLGPKEIKLIETGEVPHDASLREEVQTGKYTRVITFDPETLIPTSDSFNSVNRTSSHSIRIDGDNIVHDITKRLSAGFSAPAVMSNATFAKSTYAAEHSEIYDMLAQAIDKLPSGGKFKRTLQDKFDTLVVGEMGYQSPESQRAIA